jgi:hypothetical protein
LPEEQSSAAARRSQEFFVVCSSPNSVIPAGVREVDSGLHMPFFDRSTRQRTRSICYATIFFFTARVHRYAAATAAATPLPSSFAVFIRR